MIVKSKKYLFSYSDTEIKRADSIILEFSLQRNRAFTSFYKRENSLLESYDFISEVALASDMAQATINLLTGICEEWATLFRFEVGVLLTGSFSRYTCKSFSDIDLTVFYDDNIVTSARRYEELLYYIIMTVFDLPRRSVHPVLMNGCDLQWNNINKDCGIELSSPSKEIYYEVEKKSSETFVRSFTEYKEFNNIPPTVMSMLRKDSIHEWFINCTWIYHKDPSFNEYLARVNCMVKQRKQNFASVIKDNLQLLFARNKNISIVKIASFKRFFQLEILQSIYDALQFLLIIDRSDNESTISIRDAISGSLVSENSIYHNLLYNLFEYLWYLKKCAIEIRKNGGSYSTHTTQLIAESSIHIVGLMQYQANKIISLFLSHFEGV